jgi:predicted transcriptional regulator
MTRKKNVYLSIINELKVNTNLGRIKKNLSISKQNLNNYLRRLCEEGYVFKKGRGWYELTEKSKQMTKYDKLIKKDFVRGHAYIWKVVLPKEIEGWERRIEILEKHKFKYKLVGAKENTPRLVILGRKVWLCNNHLRIFDKPKKSYYGETALEARKAAFNEISLIVGVLNNKLGINLKPQHIFFKKEHYALVKNDLAIYHNRRREFIHVSDEFGEWLLVDDSLAEGGELENIGKKAFETNIPLQNWWNIKKKYNFEVTDEFLLNRFNKFDERDKKFMEIIEKLEARIVYLTKSVDDFRKGM